MLGPFLLNLLRWYLSLVLCCWHCSIILLLLLLMLVKRCSVEKAHAIGIFLVDLLGVDLLNALCILYIPIIIRIVGYYVSKIVCLRTFVFNWLWRCFTAKDWIWWLLVQISNATLETWTIPSGIEEVGCCLSLTNWCGFVRAIWIGSLWRSTYLWSTPNVRNFCRISAVSRSYYSRPG